MALRKSDEVRFGGEVRAVGDTGEFEGYACTFNSVDSYNSVFLPGCFTRTLKERAGKIKALWDHVDLIGKPLELREDARGLFVHGKLTLEVVKAAECYALMKDGACDTMSFAFNVVKDFYKDGVRYIQEVKLFEVSPVVFAANEDSKIVNVRKTDFEGSLTDVELSTRRDLLFSALYMTLEDIWWERYVSDTITQDDIKTMTDKAITEFHDQYMAFVDAWFANAAQEQRRIPVVNDVSRALADVCLEKRKTLAELATDTSLTLPELHELRKGKTINTNSKLAELGSAELTAAHQQQRNAEIEALCDHLRGGLDAAQRTRILALISRAEEVHEDAFSKTLDAIRQFRNQHTA